MFDLQTAKSEAAQRTRREQQKVWGKKTVVKVTADQTIDRLCAAANDVAEAFFKNMGPDIIRDRIKELQGEVAIAGKRIRR
jgi:hypothetical protein